MSPVSDEKNNSDGGGENSDDEVAAFLEKLESKKKQPTTNTNTTSPSEIMSVPGRGWSNGEVQPQMFPLTRKGRLELYAGNRRWIGLNKGWSRVGGDEGGGKTTDQYSHRTRRSSQMQSLLGNNNNNGGGDNGEQTLEEKQQLLGEEAMSVRALIAQLCEQYYRFGWATGTAGGVSIRVGGPSENRPWRVFVAPSGIQKGESVRHNNKTKRKRAH
jgi:hypothetical protein